MTSVLKKAVLGIAVAVTATPADAQYYRRYRHHGDDAALAIGAGILGLGVGAAIASSNRGYYDPYYSGGYSRGYYADPYYGGYSGYYDPYYGGYAYRCRTHRAWDPYWRRWVRVRTC
jgi:ABC-type transport system substrate-binding protein